MFIDPSIKPEVNVLQADLKTLFEEVINGSGWTPAKTRRIQAIRKELRMMGLVEYVLMVPVPDSIQIAIGVDIRGPNENLTPEQSAAYDRWFLKENGIETNEGPIILPSKSEYGEIQEVSGD